MKNSHVRLLVVALLLALSVVACKGREAAEGGDAATATIERAKPLPEPTGDDALTQTVSVEDARSPAEGGVLTDTAPTVANPGATSTETGAVPGATGTQSPTATTTR